MRIKNTSPFRTDDLRKWLLAGLKSQEAKSVGVTVKVTGARPGGMRGRAKLGHQMVYRDIEGMTHRGKFRQGVWMLIRISPEPNLADFAWLIMHEVQHLMGVRHGEMSDAMRKTWHQPMPAWAEGLPLRLKDVSPKRSREQVLVDLAAKREALVAKRAEHAKEMFERAARKEKAAKRIRQKWEAKMRYYKKKERLAAKSP